MGVIMAGAGHENWPSVAANIRVRLETVRTSDKNCDKSQPQSIS